MKSALDSMRWAVVIAACVVVTIASPAFSHGVSIDVLVNAEGQLTPFLFASGIPIPSPAELRYSPIVDRVFSDQPGIGIVNAANGVAAGTLIQVNVAEPLRYWNGVLARPAELLTIASPNGIGTYVVSAESARQTGVNWATYPGGTFWEADGFYFLDSARDVNPGLYGVYLELASPS